MHGSRHEQHVLQTLGEQRAGKYLTQMGNHAGRALELYRWDLQLSAALWNLLSVFEIVLRNKICKAIDEWSDEQEPQSNKNWIEHPTCNVSFPLSNVSQQIANRALGKARNAKGIRDNGTGLIEGTHPRKGQPINRDDIIAQVTLTQWKEAFFYREPTIRPDGTRKYYPNVTTYTNLKSVYKEITSRALSSGPKTISPNRASFIMHHAVLLRNRISHQESLIDIDCSIYRKEIFELLNCLDPNVLQYFSASDPLPEILKNDPRSK